MKFSRLALVASLGLILLGEIAWGLQMRRELAAIRTAAFSTKERRKFSNELDSIAARRQATEASAARLTAKIPPAPPQKKKSVGTRSSAPTLAERLNVALEQPEFRRLLTEQQRALLALKYAAFFKSLGLAPEQLEKFKDLLVEKQLGKAEAVSVAGASGLAVAPQSHNYLQVVDDAQKDENETIQTLLGPDAYGAYQHFEETYGTRLAVQNLQQSLGAAAPLTEDQVSQLIQAWYPALPAALQGNTTGSGINFTAGRAPADAIAPLPPNALALAQPYLSARQLQAVQTALALQQAEARLRELAAANGSGR